MSEPIIELREVFRRYPGEPPVEALAGIDLRVTPGELVAVTGASGSGKSTLLQIVGTLERPSSGSVRIAGTETSRMSDGDVSGFRAGRLGFVFQQFFLLDGLSVVDNVAMGLLYRGLDGGTRRRYAIAAIERVGLAQRARHHPAQLSGGERQRTAIARAIVGRPDVVLADEPTGNLDSATGASIVDLLVDLNHDGTTVLVITHSAQVAGAARRRIELKDGHVVFDTQKVARG